MDEAGYLGVLATAGAVAQAAFEGAAAMDGNQQRSSAVYKFIAAQAGVDVV